MRRLIKKYKWFLLIVVIFLVLVFALGQIGKTYSRKNLAEAEKYYQDIINKDKVLQQLVLNDLQNKNLDSSQVTQRFSSQDLTINNNNTPEDLKNYASNIVKILNPYTKPRENEAKIVLEAFKARDKKLLAPVTTTINLHKSTIQKLLLISVPSSATLVHLRLLNSLAQTVEALEKMANIFNTPEASLKETGKYFITASNFFWAADNINTYFSNQGIIFSKQENLPLYFNLK